MTVAVRFAPSPTGLLHVGNVRTALVTWLFARNHGGTFLLRLDDTDSERSTAPFAEAIEQDLSWLGLHWDRLARQSDRIDRYNVQVDALKLSGRVYPCYETPEELSLKRKVLLQQGKPPLYDRAALNLTNADRQALEAQGRRPHWRFLLQPADITWDDRVRGLVRFHGTDQSDPVVIREDGRPLYHLCSVIDDIDFGITDVVRGEDHVANTAAHVQMFEALGAKPPRFAHLPLIADKEGKGLSKRLGSLSLRALRDDSRIEPMALVSLLARLGTADPIEPFGDISPLIAGFDFGRFARGTPKFDEAELTRLNARILHDLPFAAAADRLTDLGLPVGPQGLDEAFWLAVRPNLETLADITDWWRVATGPVEPCIPSEDMGYVAQALDLLPEGRWDERTWTAWTSALKSATGRKGKGLFMPLRLALTGMGKGPELAPLLPLIGRDRVAARLAGRIA